MRPQKVSDIETLQGLLSVFRSKGYDGASLNELSQAAGLKKASLYHRFPGGKKDMTLAVLAFMESTLKEHVYEVLTDTKQPGQVRMTKTIENIDGLYKGGEEICMYRSLSLDTGINIFGKEIQQGIQLLLDGFIYFGKEMGMTEEMSISNAEQTFIDIQGSLVLAKSMGTTRPFKNILVQIKERYLK